MAGLPPPVAVHERECELVSKAHEGIGARAVMKSGISLALPLESHLLSKLGVVSFLALMSCTVTRLHPECFALIRAAPSPMFPGPAAIALLDGGTDVNRGFSIADNIQPGSFWVFTGARPNSDDSCACFASRSGLCFEMLNRVIHTAV
jgi:hypothetical protein